MRKNVTKMVLSKQSEIPKWMLNKFSKWIDRRWSDTMLNQFKVIRAFSLELKNENISSYAAGTAFFIFLSLIPMAMLIFSI